MSVSTPSPTTTSPTMHTTKIAFSQVPQLSKKDQAYAALDPQLRPFYRYSPTLESFAQALKDKAQDPIDRELLVTVLQDQYATLPLGAELTHNIAKLRDERTFTLTTAHQPSLFTGPLYYIYKIISTINLAERLREAYPDYHFVPVFVTGGEDHDFEEANHARVFGRLIQWQTEQRGSVGAMTTEGLEPVLNELEESLGTGEHADFIRQRVIQPYREYDRYSTAT
ncbi:MAG: bacillithiol biosynthesis BshC, partial [Bacteroidota bacterium]